MRSSEILANRETFSQEELERLNRLATGEIESPTMDDMNLYAAWKASNSNATALMNAEIEALKERTSADIANSKAIADASVEAFNAQADLAKARLKAVENGQV